MSVEAIAWALNQPFGGTPKIVLIGIANHTGASDGGWIYVDQLARYADVTERNVRKAVEWLIERGYLERDIRAGGTPGRVNPRYKPNWYQLRRGVATDLSGLEMGAEGSLASGLREVAGDLSLIEEPYVEEPLELQPLAPTSSTRRRDELFEAVCAVTGITDWNELTPSGRGPLNRAVAELRGVGATVEQVAARAMNFKLRYPDAALTPTALSKHWAAVSEPPRTMSRRTVGNQVALATARARRKEIKP